MNYMILIQEWIAQSAREKAGKQQKAVEAGLSKFLEGCEKSRDVYFEKENIHYSVDGVPQVSSAFFSEYGKQIHYRVVNPFVIFNVPSTGRAFVPEQVIRVKSLASGLYEDPSAVNAKKDSYVKVREEIMKTVAKQHLSALETLASILNVEESATLDQVTELFKKLHSVSGVTYTVKVPELVSAAQFAIDQMSFAVRLGARNTQDSVNAFSAVAKDKLLTSQDGIWSGSLNPELVGCLYFHGAVNESYKY